MASTVLLAVRGKIRDAGSIFTILVLNHCYIHRLNLILGANPLTNSWRSVKEAREGLGKLSDIHIHRESVLRKYKTTLRDLQPFPDLPFSNISQRLGVHFAGISIVQITFRKMQQLWSATENAWTSFQRKSTAHLTAPKWLQEKHIPRRRLATPQLTLHQFATSSSASTKNNCKSRWLAGWSAVGSWTTPQIFI